MPKNRTFKVIIGIFLAILVLVLFFVYRKNISTADKLINQQQKIEEKIVDLKKEIGKQYSDSGGDLSVESLNVGDITTKNLKTDALNSTTFSSSSASIKNLIISGSLSCSSCIVLGEETTGDYLTDLIAGADMVITGSTGPGATLAVANISTLQTVTDRGTITTQSLTLGGLTTPTFQLGTIATAGFVLTTDASGIGTWQPASGGGAPINATYLTQIPNGSLTNEQALSLLSTGLMKVAIGTGVVTSVTDNSVNWDSAYTNRLTSASGTAPLTLTLAANALTGGIADAAADGATKGAAAFTAADFDAAAGVISIDYVNGQAASIGTKGFLTAVDWGTFNGKINLTNLSSTAAGLTYTNTTGVFSLTAGYVIPTTTDEANWNAVFANNHVAVTLGTANGLSLATQALSLGLASAGVTGALSGLDWSTFNSKQPAGTYVTSVSGTSPISSSGGTTPAISIADAAADGATKGAAAFTATNFTAAVGVINTIQDISTVSSPQFASLTLTGNLNLPVSTATTGIIYAGTNRFIHNFGVLDRNFFGGAEAGNLTNTGSVNVGIGYRAMDALTDGYSNVGIGQAALGAMTSGYFNTVIGDSAGIALTNGNKNVALGWTALNSTTTAVENVAIGPETLHDNTGGNQNTAVGPSPLYKNTTGNENIGIGLNSLYLNLTGTGNIGIGSHAGVTITSANALTAGDYNIFIGYGAGFPNATQRTKAVAIGYKAYVNADSAIVLGGTGVDAVNVGLGATAPVEALTLASTYKIGWEASAGVVDTNLYRSAANTLKTDDSFIVSGNLGLGVSPSHKLHIVDTDTTAGRAGAYISQTGSIVGTGYGLYVTKTGSSTVNVGGYFSASGGTTNYGLIVAAGDVGIGTTVPGAKLDVNGYITWNGQMRVTTQYDKTNASLNNLTGTAVNVEAGKTYYFETVLFVNADVTGGSSYQIGGTATATAITYQIQLFDNSTNALTINSRIADLGTSSAGQAGTTAGVCKIFGTITVNAAGTIVPKFAQNAASGTSSVLVGSTFIVNQIK